MPASDSTLFCFFTVNSPAGKRLDVASPEKPHDLLVSSRNNRLADRLSEQLLAKLVEVNLMHDEQAIV